MKVVPSKLFIEDLEQIVEYIAKNSKVRALTFFNNIEIEILDLNFMPYRNRKSIYYDNESIRDLIFQGYVIIYKIDKNKNSIYILNIIKYKEYT